MKISFLFIIFNFILSQFNLVNRFSNFLNSISNVSYYVAFASDDYYLNNNNKLEQVDDYYQINGIILNSTKTFAIVGSDGSKYASSNLDDISVDSTLDTKYVVKFSLTEIFDTDNNDGYKVTNCHVTYKLYEGETCKILVNNLEVELEYNPYYPNYDVYYINEYLLNANDVITYSSANESKTITSTGIYKISCITNTDYLFNSDGIIGPSTNENFKYHLYVEVANLYYIAFEDLYVSEDEPIEYDSKKLYKLNDNTKYTNVNAYLSNPKFIPNAYTNIKYSLFKKDNNDYIKLGNRALYDNQIVIKDAGWYSFNAIINELNSTATYHLTTEEKQKDLSNYYLATNKNNYLFDSMGNYVLNSSNKFTKINEGENDYNANYDQYLINVSVNSDGLRFYITNGIDKYRNLEFDATIDTKGEYKILFSPTHAYAVNRNYQVSLISDSEEIKEKIIISTVEEYLEFAKKCNLDAAYSNNKEVFLKNDLDFNNIVFVSISAFYGIFQGTYHSLKNININSSSYYSNVFNVIGVNGCIYNLKVENIKIDKKSENNVGFIGTNYGHVEDLTISGSIAGRGNVGVIASNSVTTYQDNTSTSTQTNTINVRAIANNIYNYAQIQGEYNVGGICGVNEGEILNSSNHGNIIGSGLNPNNTLVCLGGIAGITTGRAANVSNYNNIENKQTVLYVGGCFGRGDGEIFFASNYGKVKGTKYVGGISGYFGTIKQQSEDLQRYFNEISYSDFLSTYFPFLNISQNDNNNEEENQDEIVTVAFEYCYSDKDIEADGSVGGLIGHNSSNSLLIRNSISKSNVKAKLLEYAGGIIGNLGSGKVHSSFSSGFVSGLEYVGGIAGISIVASEFKGNYTSSIVKGDNYVGGIVGYTSGSLTSNISSAHVVCDDESKNAGSIIGRIGNFDESNNTFNTTITSNYYISTLGGINKKEYGESFNDGARHIDSLDLAKKNTFSNKLNSTFEFDLFNPGNEDYMYPVIKTLTEYYYNSIFKNENNYKKMYEDNKDKFISSTYEEAKITYFITFMEWREENGSLKNDNGLINYNNYEITSYIKVKHGENISSFIYKYAKDVDGQVVYYGEDSTYIVSYDIPSNITSNLSIYCNYDEVVTSIFSENKDIIVEGFFKKGTKVELINEKGVYSIVVSYNGVETKLKNAKVKFKTNKLRSYQAFFFVDGSNLTPIIGDVDSSSYYVFTYTTGQKFTLKNTPVVLPTWVIVLIIVLSIISTIALSAIAINVVLHHKKKKRNKDNNDKDNKDVIDLVESKKKENKKENKEKEEIKKDNNKISNKNKVDTNNKTKSNNKKSNKSDK